MCVCLERIYVGLLYLSPLQVEKFEVDQFEALMGDTCILRAGTCTTSSLVCGQNAFRFRPQAFDLTTGGVVITLPEDRLFDEMEQLVLSTKHLHELIDDFVLRQPTRRVIKVGVVKAAAASYL